LKRCDLLGVSGLIVEAHVVLWIANASSYF
jgi:hypothetical protein